MARRRKGTEMAIAERELTSNDEQDEITNDEPTSITAEKAKRERVDLDTLPDDEKVMISFAVPAGMKKLLNKRGEEAQMSGASWARDQLASVLGYEIPDEFSERTRTGKYSGMTEEEVKAAKAAESKAKRDQVAALLKSLKGNDQLAEMARNAGVDISVLLGK